MPTKPNQSYWAKVINNQNDEIKSLKIKLSVIEQEHQTDLVVIKRYQNTLNEYKTKLHDEKEKNIHRFMHVDVRNKERERMEVTQYAWTLFVRLQAAGRGDSMQNCFIKAKDFYKMSKEVV